MSDNSNKEAGGDDRGRNRRNVKDLLKICAEASSNSESTDEVRSFETMTKERKEWLEKALVDMTVDPVARMRECIETIKTSSEEDDSAVETALEELMEWTEQIDLAMDFHKVGGFTIFDVCLKHDSPEVRSLCLELIATLVQNNPYCQSAVLESQLLPAMLNILDNDTSSAVKTKALYAISCLTRGVEAAEKVFVDNDGFSVLMRAMQTDVEKLKIKSAFVLSSLVVDKPEYKDALLTVPWFGLQCVIVVFPDPTHFLLSVTSENVLCSMGMIDQLVGHLSEEHASFHEHLMSALLAIVSDHTRCTSKCLRPELRTVELLRNRKKLLQGNDQYMEELEYTNKLLELLTSADSVDAVR